MRKISLTDGRLSVDILPDCGGALGALRWRSPAGLTCDILHPACAENIDGRDAGKMSCLPVGPFAGSETGVTAQCGLTEWTVQDGSNIRATLTLQQVFTGQEDLPHGPAAICQFLQRFELGPDGLRLQFTVTNIGVQPMPAHAGLRLRLNRRAQNLIRGELTPVADTTGADRCAASASAEILAGGYSLNHQAGHFFLRNRGGDVRFEWPEEKLALILTPVQGLEYVELEYFAGQPEIWLTLHSHAAPDAKAASGDPILQQGDSLEATLLLSAAATAG